VGTDLRSELLERDAVVLRHVDLLLSPRRAVVRVHAQTPPDVFRPVISLFLREGSVHDDVAVLHEVLDVLRCEERS
jgi:hypothetical protein